MSLKNILIISLVFISVTACLPYDNNYNNGYGNNGYGNNGYRYDNRRYDNDRYDYREDQLRAERERLREERRRLEQERKNSRHTPPQPPVVVRPPVDTCPSGFYPRGSKCSKKERKRGCRDTRSSTGARYCVAGV